MLSNNKDMLRLLTITLLLPSIHANDSFEQWKASFVKKAAKLGVPSHFTKKQFETVSFDSEVVKRDRSQVTKSKTLDYPSFMKRWLRDDNARVLEGKKLLIKYAKLLAEIEKKYGVDKEVIISLWGTETLYGKITGDHDLITSLSTLAFDGRRKRFFEIQLTEALRLIYKGHVTRTELKGSWAGATGQCQFMPSNIMPYAVDYDGDGRKDIWNNYGDIFASIANLLKRGGWIKGYSIGSLAFGDSEKVTTNEYKTKSQYVALGFKDSSGGKFTKEDWKMRRASKIPLKNSPIVLRGSNYETILKWNRSSLFAAFNITLMREFKSL